MEEVSKKWRKFDFIVSWGTGSSQNRFLISNNIKTGAVNGSFSIKSHRTNRISVVHAAYLYSGFKRFIRITDYEENRNPSPVIQVTKQIGRK